jgi:branched-chain amino acid transport system permease protein
LSLEGILQLSWTGITIGSIYALIALGFVAIYAVTRIINFAQGEFVMLGALIMVTMTGRLGWPMPIGFLGAVMVVSLIGAGVYRLALHPARRATVVTLIIITIGVAIAARGLALLLWGTAPHTARPFTVGDPLRIGGVVVRLQSLWVLGILGATLVVLWLFFSRTMAGRALRGCAINPHASALMGVNVERMRLYAFAMAGALGAIAGIVVTPIGLATYDMGLPLALKGFAAAVVGGLVNPIGAVLGGLMLGVAESLTAGLISSRYKEAVAFVILIGVLLARPRRLLPDARDEGGL